MPPASWVFSVKFEWFPGTQLFSSQNLDLQLAKCVVLVDDEIEQRATFLEQSGFKAFDALHLPSAEAAHVDFFCSCDDRLLKQARQQRDLFVKVLSPLELANEVPS